MHLFLKFIFGINWTVPLSIISYFFTVHTAMVYDSLLASCQQTCMTYTIAVCTVKNS